MNTDDKYNTYRYYFTGMLTRHAHICMVIYFYEYLLFKVSFSFFFFFLS